MPSLVQRITSAYDDRNIRRYIADLEHIQKPQKGNADTSPMLRAPAETGQRPGAI